MASASGTSRSSGAASASTERQLGTTERGPYGPERGSAGGTRTRSCGRPAIDQLAQRHRVSVTTVHRDLAGAGDLRAGRARLERSGVTLLVAPSTDR